MGYLKYVREIIQREYKEKPEHYKQRLIQWRKEPTIVRVERPTNIARARALGWKPIQGIIVVRVRVRKGHGHFTRPPARRPKRMGINHKTRAKSKQLIAEERANRKYPNMEVLNSYYVGEDGKYKWYEVILVDPHHPAIQARKEYAWIINDRGRVFRGRTCAGRKMRGLVR